MCLDCLKCLSIAASKLVGDKKWSVKKDNKSAGVFIQSFSKVDGFSLTASPVHAPLLDTLLDEISRVLRLVPCLFHSLELH